LLWHCPSHHFLLSGISVNSFIGAAVINFASLLHAPWFLTDRAEYRIPVRVSDCVCPVLPPPHPELQRAAAQCGDFDLARLVAELGAGAVEPVEPIAALRLTISLEHFGLAGAPEAAAAAAASAAASGVISEGAPRLADLAASYATRQLASAGASADGADGGDAGEGGASLLQQQLHQQQQQMHQAHFASQQQLMHPHLAASAPSAAAYDAHAHYAYQQQHQFEPHAQQQFATPQPGYHYGAPTDTAAAHEPGPTAHMHGHGHAAGSAESGLARPAGPIQPPTAAGLGDAAPTQSALEYQAAWELAMWKRAEQARWLAQLQEREAARMQELETEWRTQEVNREQVFARRQKEITKLEKKLKEALFDIEKQEKRLRLGEEELARRDANISTEIEAAKRDALLTITRLKDQHKHQIGMARMVHEELRRQYEIVKAKLAATQARFTELDEEYRLAKSRWGKSTVRSRLLYHMLLIFHVAV
jgi:centrosomal protein CEP120